MKKSFLTSLCALCTLFFVQAADYTIEPNPSGTIVSSSIPLSTASASRLGVITQQIYLASELTAEGASAGDITAISFYYGLKTGKTAAQAMTRTVQVWILEVPSSGVSKVDSFLVEQVAVSAYSTQYLTKYKCNGSGKAGTKVFDGSFSTTAITSADGHKKGTITFDNAFAWDGISNLVVTVADMSSTTVGSDAYTNLGFDISPTAHARFMDQIWNSGTTDNRATLLNDLTNQYGRQYGSGAKSCAEQAVKLRYVPKTTFSITPAAVVIPVPTNLAASSITTSSATLSWDAAAGATGYNVRWGKTSGSLDHSQNNVAATSLAISDLDDGETYYFDVQTITAGGTSAWASEASFTTTAITHEHNGISFSKWASTSSMPTSGNYYLANDVTYDFYEGGYLDLAGNLNLCLNGHTINLGTKSINVTNGHTMTLFDHVGGGKITGLVAGDAGAMTFKGVISVENGGTLVLHEGEVENTKPADDPEYKSIAVASGGTLIISGEPSISGNDIDIFLANNNVITIQEGKPLTNTVPYSVASNLSGTFTSGWANMSGANPKDYFVSASVSNAVCLKDGEAALRTLLNLSESSNNSSIGTHYNQVVDVNLTRSLTSSQYNTFCLPFALTNAQLEEFFGAGYDLEEFVSSSLEGDVLSLEFSKVTSLEAGKPYLLQPSADVANPYFEGVAITETSPLTVETSYADLRAIYRPTELAGDNHNLLFLGEDNTLFWPENTGNMNAFRAYFVVKGAAANAVQARIGRAESQTTAIDNQKSHINNHKYMKDGQLLIERNGIIYNAQGQTIK